MRQQGKRRSLGLFPDVALIVGIGEHT